MSASMQAPSRSLLRSLKSSLDRPACQCSRSKRLIPAHQRRWQTTDTSQQDDPSPQTTATPSAQPSGRWAQTPPAMKAPVRTRPQRQKPFTVNSDPTNLDAMYTRFLGRTGPKMLSDETKWLAVTHKSFDHGRRGFNDRLSFLGRQILELQTSLAVLTAADVTNQVNNNVDPFGRLAFHHPATANVGVLNGGAKEFYMHHKQMSGVASRYGLPEVVRWQPKDVDNLPASGSDMVYTQALFAIIGALSLEQGNQVANRIVRERILQPIGLTSDMVGTTPAQPQLNAS